MIRDWTETHPKESRVICPEDGGGGGAMPGAPGKAARKRALNEIERENQADFDKVVFTYSAAGLGVSLTFIRDSVPLADVQAVPALYASWICFVLAIAVCAASYVFSQFAVDRQRRLDKSGGGGNVFNGMAGFCNRAGGILFIMAVVATSFFVYANFDYQLRQQRAEAALP